MLRNYLTIAWRNLLRHKVFSLINILGLAIGMAACLLIFIYVNFEWSYDQFHSNARNIYRVTGEFYSQCELKSKDAATYNPVGPAMKADLPEVVNFARLHLNGGTVTYRQPGNALVTFNEDRIYFADASFLTMFSFPLLKGKASLALSEPNTAVLSARAAKRYFGSKNPMGETITWNNGENEAAFRVSGIVEDIPENSHLKFDFLLSYQTLLNLDPELQANWGWPGFHTYISLPPGVDPKTVEAKFPAFVDRHYGNLLKKYNNEQRFLLQPLLSIHLHSSDLTEEDEINGDAKTVYFLLIVAAFILVIAWVNYINLSTARSVDRAKEVGIRKVMGSKATQLVQQFLVESLLLNAMATIISLTLVQLSLPYFQQFTGIPVQFTWWSDSRFWLASAIFFVAGVFFSGLYPAIVLSSFKPVSVLKGKLRSGQEGVFLRKSLVIIQFTISVSLILGTLTVYQQLSYMRNQDLGMNIDQVLIIKGPKVLRGEKKETDALYAKNANAFKTEMLKNPAILRMTASNTIPGAAVNGARMFRREETVDWSAGRVVHLMQVDEDFLDTYELDLVAGRNLSGKFGSDLQGSTMLINEAATVLLGFSRPEQALHKKILSAIGERREVVGIIKNYHQKSLKNVVNPLIYFFDSSQRDFYTLKVNTKNLSATIESVGATYRQHFPGNPFDFFFLDTFFNEQYRADQQFGRVFGLFAGLAIFVACLGLFGLSLFTTTQRTKEIGVRKVLGATVTHILLLLSKDFIKLVFLANLLAWPLAYWGMRKWLENYAFRIEISPWLFALPSLLVLVIALLTVSFQTWKAARQNPVKSLRYE